MSVLLPLGVVVLAAVVHATFQLGLGALLLLYHASLGRHVRRQTLKLVSAFTAGFSVMILLMLSSACFFVWVIFQGTLPDWLFSVCIAALMILAILAWSFYYRRGRTTELWLPKPIAHYINRRAKLTESSVEAFSLGLLACFGEFPFTIILIFIAAGGVMEFSLPFRIPVIALYLAVAVLPLIITRLVVRSGATVVDVQRWRVKNKLFLRNLSGVGFLTLAIFLFAFKVLIDFS